MTVNTHQKFTMDEWLGGFRALTPLLADRRISDLRLTNLLTMVKDGVTEVLVPEPIADSVRDFGTSQGSGGWYYSFHNQSVDDYLSWKISRGSLATSAGNHWYPSNGMFDDRLSIADTFQASFSSGTTASAAVRSYRVSVDADPIISLQGEIPLGCAGAVEVILSLQRGEMQQLLWQAQDLSDRQLAFTGNVEMLSGDFLHLAVWSTSKKACEKVPVSLALLPKVIPASWRTLIPSSSNDAATSSSSPNQALSVAVTPQEWKEVITAQDKSSLEIALIFDEYRRDFAKQLIRSTLHFNPNREVVFHLVIPPSLREEIENIIAPLHASSAYYDHASCFDSVRWVMPFSDDSIHPSAHCKMFLADILPDDLDRVMYLDVDTTVVHDLEPCWAPSDTIGGSIGMVVDMGDVCQLIPSTCWPMAFESNVPDGDPCETSDSGCQLRVREPIQVNGGVAIFHLSKMRESHFVSRYVHSVVSNWKIAGKTARYGEQDFINSFFREYPEDLYWLPCGCNYQYLGKRAGRLCGNETVAVAHGWQVSSQSPFCCRAVSYI